MVVPYVHPVVEEVKNPLSNDNDVIHEEDGEDGDNSDDDDDYEDEEDSEEEGDEQVEEEVKKAEVTPAAEQP